MNQVNNRSPPLEDLALFMIQSGSKHNYNHFLTHLDTCQLITSTDPYPKVQSLFATLIKVAWSEPAATNALVQDEPVEAVLRMNKNPILPAHMDFFFPPLFYPKIFPPPTYHLPTPPPFTPSLELQKC